MGSCHNSWRLKLGSAGRLIKLREPHTSEKSLTDSLEDWEIALGNSMNELHRLENSENLVIDENWGLQTGKTQTNFHE